MNIPKIVEKINEETKPLLGMKVPVKVIIDTGTKEFEVKIGTPPVAALIKRELGIQRGSGEAGIKRVADLTEEQARKIAKMKFGSDSENFVSQIKGTCRSMGITIGQGEVTEEELKRYEEMDKQKEAEEAAKKVTAESVEEKPEQPKEEKGEEKTEESKEAPKEEKTKEEKK